MSGDYMRTIERLIDMLADHGFAIDLVVPARGHYRSSRFADVYRWEAFGKDARGMSITISSWDTVTDCVRRGFTVSNDAGSSWSFMVWSKEPQLTKRTPDAR